MRGAWPARTSWATGARCPTPDLQAFVEADIINPRNGRIKVYNPLVITEGTQPAAAPARPVLARGDVVAIMFGFNGDNLLLTGTGRSLQQGKCVNGAGQSLFTQVAYCNSPAFYRAANRAIAQGLLKIPALGTGNDGQACPTVRGFDVVDQDQSDNVVTTYLINAQGQTAQDSAANVTGLPGVTAINNGSDNALVNKFMDPALGCTPYEFHDKTAAAGKSGSQITDELMAAADQAAPVALVPLNDPMTQVNGAQSMLKTNLFRLGVGQPMVGGTQTRGHPRELLQEHDAGRHGPGGAGREAVQRLHHARPGYRQQPVHVPGRAAVRVVGEPRLRRAAQRAGPGQPDPRRERRGHRGHLQPAGDRHAARRGGPHGHALSVCTATPTATPTATDTARPPRPPRPQPGQHCVAGRATATPTDADTDASAAAHPGLTAAPTATATPSGTAAPVPTPGTPAGG